MTGLVTAVSGPTRGSDLTAAAVAFVGDAATEESSATVDRTTAAGRRRAIAAVTGRSSVLVRALAILPSVRADDGPHQPTADPALSSLRRPDPSRFRQAASTRVEGEGQDISTDGRVVLVFLRDD